MNAFDRLAELDTTVTSVISLDMCKRRVVLFGFPFQIILATSSYEKDSEPRTIPASHEDRLLYWPWSSSRKERRSGGRKRKDGFLT